MTTKINEKIVNLEKRLAQEKAKEQAKIAREKKKMKDQERKDDTRRKILAGAVILKYMTEHEGANQLILEKLDAYLLRDNDRALFDLAPKIK